MSGKSWESEAEAGEGDHGLVVEGSFVVAGGQGPVPFEPAEAALDHVAAPVGGLVQAAECLAAADAAVDLVDPLGDRRGDPPFTQVGADLPG